MKLIDRFLDWLLKDWFLRNAGNKVLVILDNQTLQKYLKINPDASCLNWKGCLDEFRTPITMYEVHARIEQLEKETAALRWNRKVPVWTGLHVTPAGIRANTRLPLVQEQEEEQEEEQE